MPLMQLLGGTAMKWVAGAAIAVLLGGGAWLYHGWQVSRLEAAVAAAESDLADMRDNRDQWRASAGRWEERAKRLEAERDAAREAQQALRAELDEREADYEALRERIANAPDEDDGPVAPVLRDTLEALP
ncbi:hypothetical protein NYO91_07280 [Arhodomonas aquaeolei]|uniref:hypothetical protein n=1 Tax=Arhodomonas aquaeolei TaxID=2369 RepID=UPI002166F1A7|nr:hypothetical protein [Arhodomonas aquaeolei]MCS4503878.1 hypothetical protein [Arhodomonas aquaeolei]